MSSKPSSRPPLQPPAKPSLRSPSRGAGKPFARGSRIAPGPIAAAPAAASARESYHHGDLRAALLDAAQALINERGSADLSLREVARRAQVSHGAPAHHFRNKAGLLSAYAAQGFDRMVACMAEVEAERPARSAIERLANTGRGYLRFAVANPAQFAIMYDTPGLDLDDPAYRASSDRAYGQLTAAIDQCVAEGRMNPAEAPLAVITAWSMAHGFASLWIGGRMRARSGSPVPLELGDRVIDLFVKRLVGPADERERR